jgi:hypothetical protein
MALGSDGAVPYIVPRVAELTKVGDDCSRGRASTVPDAAVGGGVAKTVVEAVVAGAAAGMGRVGVSCAETGIGRVGVSCADAGSRAGGGGSGGGVPVVHRSVFVPARGEGCGVRGSGSFGTLVFVMTTGAGGVIITVGVSFGLFPVGGVIERGADAGPGKPAVGVPGPPTRVTSAELGSATDWPTADGGPRGSSSERSFFRPSATLSSSTTVGPL